MNSQELRALQEAYNQVYAPQELDEEEGSYGQTPKATAAYGKLANKRRQTPASGFAKRGDKTKQVKSAEKHHYRTLNPDAGNRGKKSSRPYYPAGRKGMTQKDRDWSRGADEYGHTGYDGEGGGGSLPKGKKLERQRKTGVSAESFDLYDVVLSHLLDEGYAETQEQAEVIMVNMSEDWRESIVEEVLDEDANYDRNRKRAAQRAAARNAARDAGKTGAVPGVGYVTPRRESETYRDSAGVERHKTGARMPKKDVQKEQADLYDIILSHLLDEGYADTEQAAEAIMVNMSEDWREEIIEGKKEFPHKKVDRQVYDAMDSGETAGDSGNRAKETRDYGRADKMRSVAAKHGGKTRG